MSSGLEVYNNNGVLQITDKFKNIQFLSKTTATINTQNKEYYTNTVPNSGYCTVALPQITNTFYALRCEDSNPITWFVSYPVLSYPPMVFGAPTLVVIGTLNSTVTIYTFGWDNIPSGEHFEVKNSSGELVFSDKAKFMKIIDSYSGVRTADFSRSQAETVLGTTNHLSAIKTAVFLGGYCFQEDLDWHGEYTGYECILSFVFNSTSTIGNYHKHYDTNSVNYYYHYRNYDLNYSYSVVDVTGL